MEFSTAVIEKIGSYVYYLQDPINKEIFYIGKGIGNRVFEHVACSSNLNLISDKLERIRGIESKGLKVIHMIIRHGLTDYEARLIESVLIDFVGKNNLTNQVKGYHSNDYGVKTTDELILMYDAKPCLITDKAIIININRLFKQTMTENELYEATRGWWVLGNRKNNALYAIGSFNGLVREVYKILDWESRYFGNKQRWSFTGEVAESSIRNKYLNSSLENYIIKGAQNPIKYVNC